MAPSNRDRWQRSLEKAEVTKGQRLIFQSGAETGNPAGSGVWAAPQWGVWAGLLPSGVSERRHGPTGLPCWGQ